MSPTPPHGKVADRDKPGRPRAPTPSIAPARRLSSASRSAHRPPYQGDKAPPLTLNANHGSAQPNR